MSKFNLDIPRLTIVDVMTYAGAAAGAVSSAALVGGSGLGGILLAGAAGAVAGGIAIPAVLTAAAMGLALTGKALINMVKNEGKYIPTAALLVGYATARTLFEKPLNLAKGLFRKLFPKERPHTPAVAASACAQLEYPCEITTWHTSLSERKALLAEFNDPSRRNTLLPQTQMKIVSVTITPL